MEAISGSSKRPEYGVLVLGNSWASKNYISNMIIGYKRFGTDVRREPVTSAVECHRIDSITSDILIYNTPGLIGSSQKEIDRNIAEIIKAFARSPIAVVIFVWTEVDGRPQPEDVIAFRALQEAFKFSCKSLMFVLPNLPSNRPPTYEGGYITLLKKVLNPMPISLEDMIFLDDTDIEDNEKFSETRNRLLYFIAQHRENVQKMQGDILVRSCELSTLKKAIKHQYLMAEQNKLALDLQIMQITMEYENMRKGHEKQYQDLMFRLELFKQQAKEEICQGVADVELDTLHKEKKTGFKGRCQEFWKTVEYEKGVFKKVEKSYEIAKNELLVKCKSKENHEKNSKTKGCTFPIENEQRKNIHGNHSDKDCKKPIKPCDNNCNSNRNCSGVIGGHVGAVSAGAIKGAVAGAVVGAAAGAVVGGTAGVILGPCALATAAGGAVAGGAAGAAIGGISGAMIAHYRCRKQ